MVEGGQTYWLHWDQIGRPVMATDSTGSVVWAASYLPFGGIDLVWADTGVLTQNLRFPGQWFQAETGLHQNWHRDYDPTTGRYLQADPLGLVDGPSVYGYVRQGPLRYVDPTGEFAWGLVFAAGDLALQLYNNGGRLECVNWVEVGLSAIGGGFANGLSKGAFTVKTASSHSWSATKHWMKGKGILPKKFGAPWHHVFLEQGQGIGKYVPNWIKNQPWNLNPVSSQFNNWMNVNSKYGASLLGAPSWFGEIAGGAELTLLGRGNGCGCAE